MGLRNRRPRGRSEVTALRVHHIWVSMSHIFEKVLSTATEVAEAAGAAARPEAVAVAEAALEAAAEPATERCWRASKRSLKKYSSAVWPPLGCVRVFLQSCCDLWFHL